MLMCVCVSVRYKWDKRVVIFQYFVGFFLCQMSPVDNRSSSALTFKTETGVKNTPKKKENHRPEHLHTSAARIRLEFSGKDGGRSEYTVVWIRVDVCGCALKPAFNPKIHKIDDILTRIQKTLLTSSLRSFFGVVYHCLPFICSQRLDNVRNYSVGYFRVFQ